MKNAGDVRRRQNSFFGIEKICMIAQVLGQCPDGFINQDLRRTGLQRKKVHYKVKPGFQQAADWGRRNFKNERDVDFKMAGSKKILRSTSYSRVQLRSRVKIMASPTCPNRRIRNLWWSSET
ncbi:unnamed protein product, partial [Mesorhabditis spiculigera]